MSRALAVATLTDLAQGLSADATGQETFLSRVATHDAADELRAALVEIAAGALLRAAGDLSNGRISTHSRGGA